MSIARRLGSGSGAALVELLVVSGLLVLMATGVAQVIVRTVPASFAARASTIAAVLTAQKIEQLRSLAWGFTVDGVPVSDVTTDLSTEAGNDGGSGLGPSPPGTLDSNAPPYVDYLDGMGRWAGNGGTPPAVAVYVRRWSVQPLAEDPDALVLQAIVTTARTTGRTSGSAVVQSRLQSLRTRTR